MRTVSGWSSSNFEDLGRAGLLTVIDKQWTDAENFNPTGCDLDNLLYCFEQ
ncbi:MAG: hypothetical protein ACPG4T_05380 [Nannocystaceae bacterium]